MLSFQVQKGAVKRCTDECIQKGVGSTGEGKVEAEREGGKMHRRRPEEGVGLTGDRADVASPRLCVIHRRSLFAHVGLTDIHVADAFWTGSRFRVGFG